MSDGMTFVGYMQDSLENKEDVGEMQYAGEIDESVFENGNPEELAALFAAFAAKAGEEVIIAPIPTETDN